MKYFINLLLESIVILILFNVLVMLIPKPIRKGFNGTIHLVGIVFSMLFSIAVNITNLVKDQVFSYLGIKKPTRHKSSKKQSNKVINLNDKANKKES